MTEWPWLMIILALVTAVQWPSSIAKHVYNYNSNWEEYNWSLRTNNHRSKRLANEENIISTTTTKYTYENQRIEPRTNIRNTNIKNAPSNLTKSFFKTEYSINNSTIRPSNGLTAQQTKSSSVIIFPNSFEEKVAKVSINKFVPEMYAIEKCAMNESFCLKVDSYPRQDLQQIFRTSKFISSAFFGVDTVSAMNDFETRISNDLQPFCDSQEEIIFPQAGITKNNEWRYIIQDLDSDSNFKQGIRIEKCVNAESPCRFNENLPTGYNTTCVQKYSYKKLVAIKDSKEVYYESFHLPSCCACMYRVNPELLTRKYLEPESRKLFENQTKSSNYR